MKNKHMAPWPSNYLTREEMAVLAKLVDKITTGYRKFYRLPFLQGADTVSPREHATFERLSPPERIAFLENLHGELLVEIERKDDDEEEGNG